MPVQIQNLSEIDTSPQRHTALKIIQAGLDAIDTESVTTNAVRLENQTLYIQDQKFDLANTKRIFVLGFGKASCVAAAALEQKLGSSIAGGISIGLAPTACEYIQTFAGSHPAPTVQNVELSQKILDLSRDLTEKDLVIVIISGGGSSLLCWPMTECEQAARLYQAFLTSGGDIREINTIRKHLSSLKGGGLAKYLYPARVIGLIYSDVPGNNFDLVASGPTYPDSSTVADAQSIIDKYNLGLFALNETPKDERYFEKVTNIPLISNHHALIAMQQKAESLGLDTLILSEELYETTEMVAEKFASAAREGLVVLGAGEPKLIVEASKKGQGGRCQHLGLEILPRLQKNDIFAAVASDGLDNSPVAGIIQDYDTLARSQARQLDTEDYKQNFDSFHFYQKLGQEQLQTGITGTNVSDFFLLLRV